MIIYSVEITVDAAIEREWLDWMQQVHLADVIRTGCFSEGRIYKVVQSTAADPIYVIQYQSRSLEEYHRYRDRFATALQQEHAVRFAGRFHGARQLLEEVAEPTRAHV